MKNNPVKNTIKFTFRKGNLNKIDAKRMKYILRNIFRTSDGQELLRYLLHSWSYFEPCVTEQQRVLNDYAKIFLNDLYSIAKVNVVAELAENDTEE
jgi:hypothetical protein